MILGNSQSKRFRRLFNLLMDHVRTTDEAKVALAGVNKRAQDATAQLVDAMLSLLWGPEGATALFDAYVAGNPDRLSRSDLREVASWKDGSYDLYPVVRRGNDVVFVFGEYALAVRGITREIDREVELPAAVKAVIVPFDGLLTFGTTLSQLDVETTPAMAQAFTRDAERAVADHGLVRSARQYLEVVADARASVARIRAMGAELARSDAHGEGEAPGGEGAVTVHRGPLAGLDWEERKRAVDGLNMGLRDQAVAEFCSLVDETCSKAAPPATLAASLGRLTKRGLQEIVRGYQILHGQETSHMSKEELVAALAPLSSTWAMELLDEAVQSGTKGVHDLRRLVEAGGQLIVPRVADELYQMPIPVAPVMQNYHSGDDYLVWLAPEVCQELAGVDWDACLGDARALDVAIGTIRRAVELRGVVSRSEALDAVAASIDRTLLEDALSRRMGVGDAGFGEATVADWGTVFVHSRIDEVIEQGGGDEALREKLIVRILEGQAAYPPRDESVLTGYDTVFDLVESYPAYRNLIAYLDAHVPEGEDDYLFGLYVADDVVDTARSILYVSEVSSLVERGRAVCADDEQFACLSELVMALLNDVPRWSLNGWSPNELAIMRG